MIGVGVAALSAVLFGVSGERGAATRDYVARASRCPFGNFFLSFDVTGRTGHCGLYESGEMQMCE